MHKNLRTELTAQPKLTFVQFDIEKKRVSVSAAKVEVMKKNLCAHIRSLLTRARWPAAVNDRECRTHYSPKSYDLFSACCLESIVLKMLKVEDQQEEQAQALDG